MHKLSAIICSGLVLVTLAAACESTPPADEPGDGAGGTTTAGPDLAHHYSQAELTRMTTFLAADDLDGREEGSPGGQLARTFLLEEMARCGIQPLNGSHEQAITAGQGINVLGVIVGHDPALAERHVIISAHYDHIGHCSGEICNGADDNAAGVAIALGVACAFAERPAAKSVIFASWDAEEPPTFLTSAMGSQYYAQNPVVPLELTDAVLVLDLVGSDMWPNYQGHFALGAELSPQVAAAIDNAPIPEGLLAYRGGLHLAEEQPIGHQPWSDYDAFRNLQKPVLFFSNGQNKRYHTPADEMATLNLPKMEREAAYLHSIARNLADSPEVPIFDPLGADYLVDAQAMSEVVAAALAPGGLVDSLGLGAATRTKLEGDLAAVIVIANKMQAGEAALSDAEIRDLRDATQRMMCHAGSTYQESLCNSF
jgi:hypothetical protein